MARLPIGYSVRLAIIKKVEKTHVVCDFFDRVGEKPIRCPKPHPHAGRGGGVLVGIERDTIVLIATGPTQKPFIVGIVPDFNFYSNVSGKSNIKFNESEYPELEEGEISIKGNPGQRIDLTKNGNISLDAGLGGKAADIELSPLAKGLFFRPDSIYSFTEAGRSIEGIIRRDINEEDDETNLSTADLLTGESYDTFLSEIGRSPTDEVQKTSSEFVRTVTRNPAFIEKRDIIYEYADSFDVNDLESEANLIAAASLNTDRDTFSNSLARQNRRTDVLNLNLKNYNHLIERVQGTLVDIYGNVLDINRNIIPVPDTRTIDIRGASKPGLQNIYTHLRKSVKYHFEINSRKDINGSEPSLSTINVDNGKLHSRWSLDVDAEGLTKLNIPASTETGNIPVLARYVVSKDNAGNDTFKDPERRDIRIVQFGANEVRKDGYVEFAGQTIVNDIYRPKVVDPKKINPKAKSVASVTIGTAHHDIMNIASLIFTNGKFKNPAPTAPFDGNTVVPVMVSDIDNRIGSSTANAGGRSLNMNLDGSAEISIGADTADRKSLVMDLAGGVISHFGRDRNGRSMIHQTDGDIIIQVGGPGISTDSRFDGYKDPKFTEDRPGRIEIHLNRPSATPQKIIIDENGITFDIKGNGVISASGNLVLSAGGKLLLDGDLIDKYGSFDIENRTITGSEKRDRRKGRGGT